VFSTQNNKKILSWKLIMLNFSLIAKYFLLTNFSNDKQTQKSLKSDFKKIIF
jgi:hypothetical protein